jgi:hypothetical protein
MRILSFYNVQYAKRRSQTDIIQMFKSKTHTKFSCSYSPSRHDCTQKFQLPIRCATMKKTAQICDVRFKLAPPRMRVTAARLAAALCTRAHGNGVRGPDAVKPEALERCHKVRPQGTPTEKVQKLRLWTTGHKENACTNYRTALVNKVLACFFDFQQQNNETSKKTSPRIDRFWGTGSMQPDTPPRQSEGWRVQLHLSCRVCVPDAVH